ncbi:hypothetical protein [Paenibacillus pinihumi]|uniref:hypothetical protein n=1 Tax=Paenibacillus pinihumi TaxID=669462 RepID=UPI000415D275|nr:hypothetical protein [Paenibacillus pinihumi]
MESRFEIGDALTAGQAESLVSKLNYSLEGITGLRLEENPLVIVVTYQDREIAAVIETTISTMLEGERSNRVIKPRRLKDNREEAEPVKWPENDEDGEAGRLFHVNGQVLRALDGLFEQMALTMKASERHYPAFIATESLHKCDYLHTFPHNIYLINEFPHRRDVLEEVRNADKEKMLQLSRPTSFALAPAVCFHCYAELYGRTLPITDTEGPYIMTADAECSRHEANWRVGGYRMRNFRMREIVLFGTHQQVEIYRQKLIARVWSLFERMGLKGTVEAATDPFYFPQDVAKGQHQLMADSKYELIVQVKGEQFSIASFNHVGDALCKSYHIFDEQEQPLHSGCVAFGLERWCYALSQAYGQSIDQWPKELMSILHEKEGC